MDIQIYTLSYCPYCAAAKRFFNDKNLKFTEYQMDGDEEAQFRRLAKKFNIEGEVTAPQIIIDGVRIGGYSDLKEKVKNGELKF